MAYFNNTPPGQTVDAIRNELPGLLAVAIVDLETGMSLASYSSNPAFDADTAGAYHTEVIKQQRQVMQAMQLSGDRVDDLLVTLESQLHLLRLSPDGSQFLYLAVSPRETNVAIAREVVRRYAQQI